MKAVNLIPSDARRSGLAGGGRSGGSVYILLAALAVAVAFVTIYVTTTNRIASQQAKITSLRTEATDAQGAATRLAPYVEFAKLAQARTETIRELAASRFDWHAALAGLSRVVPANTSLQSLTGSVVPGVTINGSSAGSGSSTSLRGDVTAPAFELAGCSDSQDDVARLVSRLRLIDGVTRVSLENTQKTSGAQAGTSVSSSGGSSGCGANRPSFDLVVFFQTLANAGADGATSVGAPVSSTTSTGGSK